MAFTAPIKTKSIVSLHGPHVGRDPPSLHFVPFAHHSIDIYRVDAGQKLSSHRHYPIAAGHMDSPARAANERLHDESIKENLEKDSEEYAYLEGHHN